MLAANFSGRLLPAHPGPKPVPAVSFSTRVPSREWASPLPKGPRLRGYSGGGRRRPARPTTGRQGRGGGCEGRGGTGRPLWRRGRGSSLLGGIRLISLGLRLTTSLPPLKTPKLQSWRRIPSAGGSQPPRRGPNLSSSIRGSERTRLRTGSAGGGPAPLRPGVGAAPPPSAAAMLIPGERGGDGIAPRLSAPLPWPLPALVTPEESPLR